MSMFPKQGSAVGNTLYQAFLKDPGFEPSKDWVSHSRPYDDDILYQIKGLGSLF